jgi:hypothetical protein
MNIFLSIVSSLTFTFTLSSHAAVKAHPKCSFEAAAAVKASFQRDFPGALDAGIALDRTVDGGAVLVVHTPAEQCARADNSYSDELVCSDLPAEQNLGDIYYWISFNSMGKGCTVGTPIQIGRGRARR